ncbi:MAG: hypothetical protein EOM59_10730 [Clostridia bacterium]|nr:hypothetical protein [Clostridia bacterium]
MDQADKLVEEAKARVELNKENVDLDVRKIAGKTIKQPTFRNAIRFLETNPRLKGLFRYNEFSHAVEMGKTPPWGSIGDKGRTVSTFDDLALKEFCIKEYECELSNTTIRDAVNHDAKRNSYNPVKEYLESLKWDKKPRIGSWLKDYLGVVPDLYSNYIGRMHLLAAVCRVYKPGCMYHYMLILEGAQGIGKSRTAAILGGPWYRSISLIGKDKDIIEKMQGAWIIEVAELAAFKKRDIESLKDFISSEKDTERLSYDARISHFPRHNIFLGTVNPDNTGYLTDSTGNRRFLPVNCTRKVSMSELQRDRDQLWAEAVQAYKDTPDLVYKLFLPDNVEALAIQYQEDRQTRDDWQDKIEEWLIKKDTDRVHGLEIWTECFQGFASEFDRGKQIRISNIMRRIKWDKKTIWKNGKTTSGYFAPEKWQRRSPWDEEEEWKTVA